MITVDSVRDALRDRFGSVLLESPGFSEEICQLLLSYTPYRDSFSSLARKMEDFLFNALYERLGPGMSIRLDDGYACRIHMSDLPAAADAALFPLFASLKPYSVNYEHLHSFWLNTGSFSAMRALYLFFSDFLPAQELTAIERIVLENVPVSLQASWFLRKD